MELASTCIRQSEPSCHDLVYIREIKQLKISQIFVEILCPHTKNALMGLKYCNGPQEESSNLLEQTLG